MKAFRKFVVGLLGITIVFNLYQVTASAKETITYISTEEGTKIGVDMPIIKSTSAVSVSKNKSNSGESKYELTMNKEQNSVTVSFLIAPSLNGSTLEIPLVLTNGESVVLMKGQEDKIISAGNIYNKDKRSIGVISTKVDNNQEKINITQKMNDNKSLIINIGANKKSLNVQVDLAVSNYSTYFSAFSWITRGGKESLSLSHKPYLTDTDDYLLSSVKRIDAWDKVVSLHGQDVKWSNTNGLKNQFDCHYYFAKQKDSWNIESSRKDVGYMKTVFAGCNP
ncbi:DUF2599 domain-containing protein [Psychrobacillus sp. FJAT-51614]|uniref:DUF2599 domain-containing protein n=1 Tax=Psychrobacillus mangrovi TaxID=3117745 RepID=A0ABU8F205_9BACI